MTRFAVLFGALAVGLISLPMQASAQCHVYFPSDITVDVPFLTYWTSGCTVCDWLPYLPPVIPSWEDETIVERISLCTVSIHHPGFEDGR